MAKYTFEFTDDEMYYLSDLLVPLTEIGDPIANSIYNQLQTEIDPYGVMSNNDNEENN